MIQRHISLSRDPREECGSCWVFRRSLAWFNCQLLWPQAQVLNSLRITSIQIFVSSIKISCPAKRCLWFVLFIWINVCNCNHHFFSRNHDHCQILDIDLFPTTSTLPFPFPFHHSQKAQPQRLGDQALVPPPAVLRAWRGGQSRRWWTWKPRPWWSWRRTLRP